MRKLGRCIEIIVKCINKYASISKLFSRLSSKYIDEQLCCLEVLIRKTSLNVFNMDALFGYFGDRLTETFNWI